jgi:serine/threonine-protein kinase
MAKGGVAPAILASMLTTTGLFFGFRALEMRGILPPSVKHEPAAVAPPPAEPKVPVDVPSLIGMRSEHARELLQGRGLLLAFSGEREDAKIPAGAVADQVPLPGSQLPKGAAVQAVLSRGAPLQKPIPKVTGMRLRAAKELLEKEGFKAGKIRWGDDGDRGPGVILDQKPAPPAVGMAGATVDLVVNEE